MSELAAMRVIAVAGMGALAVLSFASMYLSATTPTEAKRCGLECVPVMVGERRPMTCHCAAQETGGWWLVYP